MILHKNLLLFVAIFFGLSLQAQQYKIKGKILDEKKEPLSEVLVRTLSSGRQVLTCNSCATRSLRLNSLAIIFLLLKSGQKYVEF